MRFRVLLVMAGAVLAASGAMAQTLGNSSLTGKYYFVHLLVTAANSAATDVRSLSGSVTFDGNGGYTFTGKLGTGAGAPGATTGSGTYAVTTSGDVTLTNPIRNTLQVTARLGEGAMVVLGVTSEAADNTNDLFVAIKAPATTVTNAAFIGAFTGASLQLPDGSSAGIRSAMVAFASNGAGQFSRATVTGHAADQNAGRNSSQEASNSTYSLNGDGTGTASFGSAAALFTGTRDIFLSADGNYLLGMSSANGGRDIFIATKNFTTPTNAAAFNDQYWAAELIIYSGSFSAASGSIRATGDGRATIAERLHQDTAPLDFTTVNFYTVNSDGTGSFGPVLGPGATNMALGVPVTADGVTRPGAMLSAQVGAVNAATVEYGVSLFVRTPRITGSGTFLFPTGVLSNAGRAPTPNPVGLGAIVELYGSSLAPRVGQPATLPLPTSLEGVSATINGQSVPLFYVSPGQVNIQVPFEVAGSRASVQVNNNGTISNTVTIPAARTSPAVYSYSDAQSPNRAIILHSDGVTLVTPQNGAKPGEVVIIYVTGLGPLTPAVASGAANPGAEPLARVTDPQLQVLFGGEVASNVTFAGGAPFFAGLNQINVTVPSTAPAGTNIPVAIVTSNAYTDLTDITIAF